MPPSSRTGAATFGSCNNPAKLSDATLDVWARLFERLPQARLLLKGRPFADAVACALILSRLSERRIGAGRVELMAWQPDRAAHLALYDRVDIALDPFPYNGTTTTCEALWMGVPVITLKGARHAGRVGASLLTQAGLTDWIAESVEDHLQIATTLAGPAHLKGKVLEARCILCGCDSANGLWRAQRRSPPWRREYPLRGGRVKS
jgi:protein O-GlcNAc transferase